MKYIRTTDGRIINTQIKTTSVFDNNQFFILNENELVERYPEEYGKMGMWCCRYQYRFVGIVEKQSDTIEELCDAFVLFREGKPYAIVPNEGHNAELTKNVWKDYRGAIWTEWGLKYVAKMNVKGELELL